MSTIQSDVQGEAGQKEIVQEQTTDDNSAKVREPSARELAMDAISASRNEAFEKESGIKLVGDETQAALQAGADEAARVAAEAGAQDDELDAQQEAQQAAAAAAAAAAKVVPDDFLKQKVKVKINGVESEASIEDMQRVFQKSESADRRLAEAARRERELQDREVQLQQQVADSKKVTEAAPAPVDPAEAKAFAAAMFEGDEGKAVEAFNKAVSKAAEGVVEGRLKAFQATQPAQVDIDQITATVEQRFVVNSALKKSQTDYPELYADPDLEELAAAKIRRKQSEEGLSFADALEATGSELATKFGWQKPGHPAKADTTARDKKLAAKAALDPVVGTGAKTSTTEPAPMTHSQIIADMQKQRGQSV
jgi:colicin import membrane protein